jgi:hypothetical protein
MPAIIHRFEQRRRTMRFLATSAVLAFIASVPTGRAASAQSSTTHYCAYYNDGSINCYFHSFGECDAAISGVGGVCRVSILDSRR